MNLLCEFAIILCICFLLVLYVFYSLKYVLLYISKYTVNRYYRGADYMGKITNIVEIYTMGKGVNLCICYLK